VADGTDAQILIVARLRDEASAGLAALEKRIGEFAAAAGPSSQQMEGAATELARVTEEAGRRIGETAETVRNIVREAGAGAPGGSPIAPSGLGGPEPRASAALKETATDAERASQAIDRYIRLLGAERAALQLAGGDREKAAALARALVLAETGGIEVSVEQREAIIREVAARQDLRAELDRQAAAVTASERASDAVAKVDEFVAALGREREALSLTAAEREIAAAVARAEQIAKAGGTQLSDQQRAAVVREAQALQSLQQEQRGVAELEAVVARETQRNVEQRRAEEDALTRGKVDLDRFVKSIGEERSLLKLDANEREIVVAQRRAEDLAIRAGILDREKLLAKIREEIQLTQRARGAAPGGVTISQAGQLTNLFAPGALSGVVGQAQQGASAFEGMATAAGLSAGALGAVAAAGAGVALTAAAIGQATKASLELDEALRPVAARSQQLANSIGALKDEVRALARETGQSEQELAAGLAAIVQGGVADATASVEFLRVAADVARATGEQIPQSAAAVDSVLDAFNLKADRAREVADQLFVAAREGETSFARFAGAMQKAGTVTSDLGIPLQETAAFLASVARRTGNVDQAATALVTVLAKAASATDETRKRLRDFGVDASEAAIRSKGLTAFIEELQAKVGDRKDLLADFFGSARTASAFFAAISDAQGAARSLDAITRAENEVAAAAKRATTAGEEFARLFKNIRQAAGVDDGADGILLIGRRLAELTNEFLQSHRELSGIVRAGLLGPLGIASLIQEQEDLRKAVKAPLELPKVESGAVREFEAEIAAQFKAGRSDVAAVLANVFSSAVEQARAEAAKSSTIFVDVTGKLVSQPFSETEEARQGFTQIERTIEDTRALVNSLPSLGEKLVADPRNFQVIQRELLASTDAVERLNHRFVDLDKTVVQTADGPRRLARFFRDAAGDIQVELEKIGAGAGVDIPLRVGPPDRLQRDIDRVLALVPPPSLAIDVAVEPESVTAARAVLEQIRNVPKLDRSADSEQRAAEALDALTKYRAALDDVIQVQRQLTLAGLEGTDRQRVELANLVSDLEKRLALDRQIGAEIENQAEQLAQLEEITRGAQQRQQDRQATQAEQQRLQILSQIAEKNAEIARVTGDVAQINAAERTALNARLALAEQGYVVDRKAAEDAVGANAELKGQYDAQLRAKRQLLDVSKQQSLVALGIAVAERERSRLEPIIKLQLQIKQGLDAEIAGIREAGRVRLAQIADEQKTRADLRLPPDGAIGEEAAQIRSNEPILIARAEENAQLTRKEQLAQLAREIAATTNEQAAAEREIVALSDARLEREFKLAGASDEERKQLRARLDQRQASAAVRDETLRAFGTDNVVDVIVRPHLDFDLALADAEVQAKAQELAAGIQQRFDSETVHTDAFKQAVRQAREEYERFRQAVESRSQDFGTGFIDRLRDAMRELGNDTKLGAQLADDALGALTSNTTDALTTLENNLAKGKLSIGDFVASLARDLQQAINRIIAFKIASTFLNFLFAGSGGATTPGNHGIISRAQGGVFEQGAPVAFARGAAFDFGAPIPFARGGIFDQPTTFPVAGGRLGLLGEAGPEAILPLRRTSDGALGVRAHVGEQRQGERGGITIHVGAPQITVAPVINAVDTRTGADFLHAHAKDLAAIMSEQLERDLSNRLGKAIARHGR
jgi:TP901 family phage tail tape measure protein